MYKSELLQTLYHIKWAFNNNNISFEIKMVIKYQDILESLAY